MIPGAFDYHRPKSLDEAVALLAEHGDEGRLLAGGHSLIPMMKLRLANPSHLIDLHGIAGLAGIEEAGDAIRIGAMTTQADVIASDLLAAKLPILRETALQIADPQVRYCGTLGGNVANGDPGNDMPAVMMALDAAFVVQGPAGERTIAARDYYQSAFTTALADDEVLAAIRIPLPPAGHGWAYQKMKRKVGDYATAAAAVLLVLDGEQLPRRPHRAHQRGRGAAVRRRRGPGADRHRPRRCGPRRSGGRRAGDHRPGGRSARARRIPQARHRRDDPARAGPRDRAGKGSLTWPNSTSSSA